MGISIKRVINIGVDYARLQLLRVIGTRKILRAHVRMGGTDQWVKYEWKRWTSKATLEFKPRIAGRFTQEHGPL